MSNRASYPKYLKTSPAKQYCNLQDERHRRDDHVDAWLLRGCDYVQISMAPVMGIHLDHQGFDSIGFVWVGFALADLVIW